MAPASASSTATALARSASTRLVHSALNEADRLPISRGNTIGRAVVDRRTVNVPTSPRPSKAIFPRAARTGPPRPSLGRRRTAAARRVPIGSILLYRKYVQPLTKEIALLETFADQAVVAIEQPASSKS